MKNVMALNERGNGLVLIAEDDPDYRELLGEWLRLAGIRYVAAASVAEAIAAVRANAISVALLDWALDRSALEVLRVCREVSPDMYVIVLSGRDHDVRTDALLNGADGFLQKLGV